MTTQTTPAFRFAAVTFDCADPAALSRFYAGLLGYRALFSTDDFILLGTEGTPGLGFTRVADYRPPTWPDSAQGKQAHVELGVDDLEAAERRALELGATKPEFQPGEKRWTVLLDPAGHPFCVTTLA